jgi:predicted acetyltransferase
MSLEITTCSSLEELRDALAAIGHYFGFDEQPLEDIERFSALLAPERMHAARDDGRIVGGAGVFPFRLSIPGGEIAAAGVTVVGVLPTHRRRGALTAMMRAQLEDCRARGESVAYLWASEATIYGRFGYGMASLQASATIQKDRAQFARPFDPRGTFRLVDLDEALETFPPLYDRCFAQRPGMFGRTRAWWEIRRLRDDPARRRGRGPKNLVLLELDGEPAGYAIYHVKQDWAAGVSVGTVSIAEAVAPAPEATRELWRWLLDFDWTSQFSADILAVDHPLLLLVEEPQRLQFTVGDGLWLRLVDVGRALSARSYQGDGEVVLEVDDAFLPGNAGRWRVTASGAERTDEAADLALGVDALGSTYLGGFTFAQLVAGGRAEELVDGAVARADALFRTTVAPWCAEIF